MKKTLFSLMLCAVLATLCGCKANCPVAQQSGDDDVAYLIFVSTSDSRNKDVEVFVDDKTRFTARTVKSRKSNRRGTRYSVQTGKRKIRVVLDGKTLYDKYVFLSPQETKKITLP